MAEQYDHVKVEKKWRERWEASAIYLTKEDPEKPKMYVLDMFPYPSGEGLHVGHPKGYIATDVFSRMKQMQGFSVLHPMGWDAFGLPAENFAIKNKIHPRAAVEKNIARFKQQLSLIGFNYDWQREINTTDPEYYRWTQWIFLKLYERGLAYQAHEPINWCPSCQTGLSNEDLEGGACERCGSAVEQRRMRQWVLKITAYADRLLDDLELLPRWQAHIKESQRNWIGRSEGALLEFPLAGREERIRVFTTRPDTLYGVTYMVLAPEHPLVLALLPSLTNQEEVRAYIEATRRKTELERQENREKTGCELVGVRALHPATKEELPLFIADYVLAHYGTGAIMAVPAHDERDRAFAHAHRVPLRTVVEPVLVQTQEPGAYRPDMPLVDSDSVIVLVKHWNQEKYLGLRWKSVAWGTFLTGGVEDGMTPAETVAKEVREETGFLHFNIIRHVGKVHSKFFHVPKNVNKFAHSDVFEVQLIDGEQRAIAEDEAAKHDITWLTLDELETFLTATSHKHILRTLRTGAPYVEPGILTQSGPFTGMASESAKKAITEHVSGSMAQTYRLKDWVFSRQRYWGEPIPVIHCESCGVVPVPEKDLPVTLPDVEHYEPTGSGESPLAAIDSWVHVSCPKCNGPAKRETNTMPQWAGSSWYYLRYVDPHNKEMLVGKDAEQYWAGKTGVDMYVGGAEHATRHLIYARFWHKVFYDMGIVSTPEPFDRLVSVGLIMAEDGKKMSKRYGNVINPDDIVATWGADTLRVYEMFMGPFTDTIAWDTNSMVGSRRFLERLWRLALRTIEAEPVQSKAVERELHKTIKKAGEDIQEFKFNTAIAQMMVFLNLAEKEGVTRAQLDAFVRLLAPFAPHVAEEIWERLGNAHSVHHALWPSYDERLLVTEETTLAVQVNGKLRGTLTARIEDTEAENVLRARQVVAKWLEGNEPKKVIYVSGKIVNFIV